MKGIAYLIQASLISVWWICLLLNESFFDVFQFPGIGELAFNSLFLPDVLVIVILSVIIAYKGKSKLQYIVLGAFAYAALYCVNATILTGGGLLSTTIMLLGLSYNIFLVYAKSFFRSATTSSLLVNGLKTLLQIICVWAITLFVFPFLIIYSFSDFSMPIFASSIFGFTLLFCFSIFNLYAGYTMVKNGNGTPLPLDQTQKLVLKGPYRFLRNPMAVAGVGQVLSIGLIFHSIPVALYGILGGVLWHFVVKPLEEADLSARFGAPYDEYKSKVNCWLPKFQGNT